MAFSQNSLTNDEQELYLKSFLSSASLPFYTPFRAAQPNMSYFQKLRDERLDQYPVLPGALYTFVQMVAGREWMITAPTKRAADRAVTALNNAVTYDWLTGDVLYGYDQMIQRQVLDYLVIGLIATVVPSRSLTAKHGEIEYLDPTQLVFQREGSKQNKNTTPVKPNEYVWFYPNNRQFRAHEVHRLYALPKGNGSYISPISYLIPYAELAVLLLGHDLASIDGRRIKDLLFVGNNALKGAIQTAIQQHIALWQGADPTRTGIPVIELQNPSGQPIASQIFTLGLSKVPEAFDREQFMSVYVNQIAAATGLSLRHFWNDEKTTNRALEQVQEQRQQQKGPSYLVRQLERYYNRDIVKRLAGNEKAHIYFIEESDLSSRMVNANVLLRVATAIKEIQQVFGARVPIESYLDWMKTERLLPEGFEISEVPLMVDPSLDPTTTTNPQPTTPTPASPFKRGRGRPNEGKQRLSSATGSDPSQFSDRAMGSSISATEELLKAAHATQEYGDVTVGRDGRVVNVKKRYWKGIDIEPETVPSLGVDRAIEWATAQILNNHTLPEEIVDILSNVNTTPDYVLTEKETTDLLAWYYQEGEQSE